MLTSEQENAMWARYIEKKFPGLAWTPSPKPSKWARSKPLIKGRGAAVGRWVAKSVLDGVAKQLFKWMLGFGELVIAFIRGCS